MKDLDGEGLKKMIKSGKPVAIFFRMEGCPHCEVMERPWKELEKEVPRMEFCKIESADIPEDKKRTFSGFPHFEVHGKTRKTADGEMSKEDLKKKLFGSAGGARRRNTRRLVRRRRRTSRR